MHDSGRRRFLKHGLVAASGVGLGGAALWQLLRSGEPPAIHPALGPLQVAKDLNTGLPILKLPEGFRYRTFAWAGEQLADGFPCPGAADGMGVVADEDGVITLIRNQELTGSSGPIGDPDNAWDLTGGGTTTLKFDTHNTRLVDARISLNGTAKNCAGGVTPWGTWLSCEECPVTPELLHHGTEIRQWKWHLSNVKKSHGYVFEVHPEGETDPQPIIPMGQFYHEAAAIDPVSGMVYMTEDNSPQAGLYRYVPNVAGQLQAGGRLQMLRVSGHKELIKHVAVNQPMSYTWVDIAEPGQGHSPGSHDCAGVVKQGMDAGATAFLSLEGCAYHQKSVYFTSKGGGEAGAGQIFRMDLENNKLELVYEAVYRNGFSGPDNIIVSPKGSLMICEDRVGLMTSAQRIAVLDPEGQLFEFCQVNPKLKARYKGHRLKETILGSEWAGVSFSTDGQWMFANLYNPGVTVAITGPWQTGPI